MRTREIERKFLVRNDKWRGKALGPSELRQGYLLSDADRSVRIRLVDGRSAFLTVKFGRQGMVRDEFEYRIPRREAEELLERVVGTVIEKSRYKVSIGGFVWEVDVFHGAHAGLTIAEIEMLSETDRPLLPRWLGLEVTGDPRYSNRALATTTDNPLIQSRPPKGDEVLALEDVCDLTRQQQTSCGPD